MKNYIYTIYIILFCTSINVKGQNRTLQGVWISKDNDVIKIDEEGQRSNILSTDEEQEHLNVKTSKDSLSFYTQYIKLGSDKSYISYYNFYIKEKTNSKLTLIPTSQLSKDFFKNKKEIILTKQEFNFDKSISFEKLIYHTTSCYGSCSTIDLEIDNNKNIFIHREIFNDKINSGNFTGTLSEKSYNELIKILQTSNLRLWTFSQKEVHDAPATTLIIYYNGKRKYFKSTSPPAISQPLIDLLYNIGEKTTLIRTDKKRQIEY